MRFVIQSSIYVVIVAILLHAALAITLPVHPHPDAPDKPGDSSTMLAQEKSHEMLAAWHGKKSEEYHEMQVQILLTKAVKKFIWEPGAAKHYKAAAKMGERSIHHRNLQHEYLRLLEESRKKREGEPA